MILAEPLYGNYGFYYWGHDKKIYRVPDDGKVRIQMEERGRFSYGCLEDILAHPDCVEVQEVDRSYGRRD
jgi:hypothetical protein